VARSVAVGAAAWEHAGDLDHVVGLVEQQQRSPVPDPQASFGSAGELAQLTGLVGLEGEGS
jgi:hypothetical protein